MLQLRQPSSLFYFVVDVICLSLLTFSVGEPNLQLSLLYVIAIFTSAILLSARMSLLITLLAVIAVIYQRFVGSLFDYNNLNTIGNSALLAFLFCGAWHRANCSTAL